jgi:hypothetical protein
MPPMNDRRETPARAILSAIYSPSSGQAGKQGNAFSPEGRQAKQKVATRQTINTC